jgi:hypothetical protein
MGFNELDWEGQDPPGPATESSKERGYESDMDEDELGQSEALDDDTVGDVGDIGDEGPGHRG